MRKKKYIYICFFKFFLQILFFFPSKNSPKMGKYAPIYAFSCCYALFHSSYTFIDAENGKVYSTASLLLRLQTLSMLFWSFCVVYPTCCSPDVCCMRLTTYFRTPLSIEYEALASKKTIGKNKSMVCASTSPTCASTGY